MTKSNENRSGINSILNRARVYDNEIGNYCEHFINKRFSYTVRLTNGRIEIPMNMAQDQEKMPSSITEERIQVVAQKFVNDNPNTETVETEIAKIKKLSFWERFFKMF